MLQIVVENLGEKSLPVIEKEVVLRLSLELDGDDSMPADPEIIDGKILIVFHKISDDSRSRVLNALESMSGWKDLAITVQE